MTATVPLIAAAEAERVATEGGPDDMVLLTETGALLLDSTPDDIRTYQVPGSWPRYLCRVSTVAGMIRRTGAEHTASALQGLMVRQFALESLKGPHHTGAPVPPGNAPVRIGESAVTIHNV